MKHKYNISNIFVTFKVFQVAYVIIKAANSPRPGNWILEKSIDGFNWEPWQFFAISNRYNFKSAVDWHLLCYTAFSVRSLPWVDAMTRVSDCSQET